MKNSYFTGVDRAMMSSKPSLEQQYDSFNNALMAISESLAQNRVGRQKGFINNLAAFAPIVTHGHRAYNQSQKQFEEKNESDISNAIKEQQAYATLQEKKDYHARQDYWKQRQDERAEDQGIKNLAYKRKKLDILQGKEDKEANKGKGVMLGNAKVYPMTDQSYKDYQKGNTQAAKLYVDIKDVKNKHKELDKLLESIGVDPNAPYSHSEKIALVRSVKGNLTNDPILRKIDALEKDINSSMKQINIVIEKAEKGGEATNFLVKYAEDKGLFPDINESSLIFNKKLNNMGRSIDQGLKAINYSLDKGYSIPVTAINDYKKIFGDNSQYIGDAYTPNFFQDEEELPQINVPAQTNAPIQPQSTSPLSVDQNSFDNSDFKPLQW